MAVTRNEEEDELVAIDEEEVDEEEEDELVEIDEEEVDKEEEEGGLVKYERTGRKAAHVCVNHRTTSSTNTVFPA
jgi:hypothetical protein